MSRTAKSLGVVAVAAFVLTIAAVSGASPVPVIGAVAPTPSAGELKPLAAGTIEIDPATLAAGEVVTTVDPRPGVTDATVAVSGTGEASVTGGATTVPAEASTTSASVTVTDEGPAGDPAEAVLVDANGSTVVATLTATSADGVVRTASDTVWIDQFEGHTLVSVLGEQDLRLQRVGVLEDAGTVTSAEADALEVEVRGGGASTSGSVIEGGCVGVCVSGTVLWTDRNSITHPVDRAPVDIFDEEAGADQLVTTVTTDANGDYSATIDNNDGDATGRDIYVRVRAAGPGFDVRPGQAQPTHFIDSTVSPNVPTDSDVTKNLTTNITANNNTAFSVQAAMVIGGDFVVDRQGSLFDPIPVIFPGAGTFFDGTRVHLLQLDRWDWDVTLHEFGHYVAQELNIENNPGGPHSTGNLSDQRGSKDIGVRLAYGEGWPTFMAVSALRDLAAGLGVPNVGDTSYQDTEDINLTANLETATTFGEDSEDTVMDIFWDIYDNADDGLDQTSRGSQFVWNTLDANDRTTLSGAYLDFSPNRGNGGVNCIFTQMNVSPRITAPANVGTARPTFRWSRGNGGTHPNNRFTVAFRRNNGSLIFASPSQTGVTYQPTQARWNSIRNSTNVVRVSVTGRQIDPPATGPYRSCSRAYNA